MARGRNGGERVERLRALFDAGDHGAVRRLARALAADASATSAEREEAAALLARIAPDRGVVIAGALGVATAVAITAWLLGR